VQPLETFQSDIEKYIRSNDVSEKDQALRVLEEARSKQPLVTPVQDRLAPPPPPNPAALKLPSTEIHSPLNAQRVSASELVAQETSATLPKRPAPPLPPRPKPASAVPPLQTYQGDAQQYITQNKVSSVTIAAAEEKRRRFSGQTKEPQTARSVVSGFSFIVAGLLLLCVAGSALFYVYYLRAPLPISSNEEGLLIAVDEILPVPIKTLSRGSMMQELVRASETKLAKGLAAQLVPTQEKALQAKTFFEALIPSMPAQLMRTLESQFTLGVHFHDSNQPFLLLRVDSYQTGYAGMLAWEQTMAQDLSPLFAAPSVQARQPIPEPILTTGSSTPSTATSSPASTTQTTPPAETMVPRIIPSAFSDRILENHDARVLENEYGQIRLLWTFLDRKTILITTNQRTVEEVLSRLTTMPTISTPR